MAHRQTSSCCQTNLQIGRSRSFERTSCESARKAILRSERSTFDVLAADPGRSRFERKISEPALPFRVPADLPVSFMGASKRERNGVRSLLKQNMTDGDRSKISDALPFQRRCAALVFADNVLRENRSQPAPGASRPGSRCGCRRIRFSFPPKRSSPICGFTPFAKARSAPTAGNAGARERPH